MNVLCFDIGGTEIKSMLKTSDKAIFFENFESKASEDARLIVDDLFARIREVKARYDLDGIAISTAGMVDSKTGIIAYTNENFKNYMGLDWKKEIYEEFSLPALVENDVKAAAMGEFHQGAGKDFASTFTLTVGTGIGGALILDGKINRGASGQAGEIGYMDFFGKSFESLASTSALLRRAKEDYPAKAYANGKEIFEAIDKGDEDAKALVGTMTDIIAMGISHIMLIVNPEAIIIGGGISQQEKLFIDPIREKIKGLLPQNIYESTTITSTKLGNKSGMYGAYHLFLEKYKDN